MFGRGFSFVAVKEINRYLGLFVLVRCTVVYSVNDSKLGISN